MVQETISNPEAPFVLCVVASPQHGGAEDASGRVKAAVRGGADAVQARAKGADGKIIHEFSSALSDAIGGDAFLLVNDRADVAKSLPGAGLHIPAGGLSVADGRKLLGPDRLIGASTHSIEEVEAYSEAGADYVIFGPVYETESKKQYGPPQGLDKLKEAVSAAKIPVIAIGGIVPEKVPAIKKAGAKGVAVMSFVMDAKDPEEAATALRYAWND